MPDTGWILNARLISCPRALLDVDSIGGLVGLGISFVRFRWSPFCSLASRPGKIGLGLRIRRLALATRGEFGKVRSDEESLGLVRLGESPGLSRSVFVVCFSFGTKSMFGMAETDVQQT